MRIFENWYYDDEACVLYFQHLFKDWLGVVPHRNIPIEKMVTIRVTH
jgi:hypothetical protein